MFFVLAVLMQTITTEQLQTELAYARHHQTIVDDAIGRWSHKNGNPERAKLMSETVVIVSDMGTERCVILQLRAPAVGGSPVYCYSKRSSKLVRSFDDVE